VADITIRPTRKWIRFGYWMIFLVCCVAVGLYVNKYSDQVTPWLLAIPALLFVFPIRAHIRQHLTRITIAGDKLRYETGVLSKTTRTIQLSKVQDVRVDQSLLQRLSKTGRLSIETAGEASRLTIEGIDHPQAVADLISDASQSPPARSDTPAPKKKGERA